MGAIIATQIQKHEPANEMQILI